MVCCAAGVLRACGIRQAWQTPLSPIFPWTGETFEPTFSLLLFKRLNVNILIAGGQNDPKNKRLDSSSLLFSGDGPSIHHQRRTRVRAGIDAGSLLSGKD
jgi:hypothetical protein